MVLIRNSGRTSAQYLNRVVLFICEIVSLCLPALVNQAPLVYPDTRSYFMGGRAAIEKVASLFAHHAGGSQAVEAAVEKARGVRSAFYALFTYIPAVSVSLWLVIVLQAIIVAVVLRFLFRLAVPAREPWQATAFIVALALFTTVSWATCNVMPDIFTSIMAICIAITMVGWRELPRRGSFWLTCGIAGSMVMHVTNLPIALGLLVVGCLMIGAGLWQDRHRIMMVIGAIVAGVAAMLVVGVVGFHQWSIAPQSPPFLLARSLQDGPGRLYLLEHCPQIGLDMCKHLDKLDLTSTKFIWDDDGLYSAVSPEEEAQLRAEDKRIYLAAALEHPWMQVKAMAHNALLQLITFGIHEYYIPSWADYTANDMKLHMPDQAPWQTDISVVQYCIVFGSLGFIALAWRNLPRPLRQLAIMMIATALVEALAGAISEPVPRYEARVIWLIPMTALLIWFSKRPARLPDRA
jgi:hypothetical protein